MLLVSVLVGARAGAQGTGYWHTSGNLILDSNNQQVRIAGINWYGFETTSAVPHGLYAQDYKAILQTIQSNGYNTIRIPLSSQMIETPSSNLNVTYGNGANSDLQGLNSLQVLDKIISYAGTLGLKVILDHHRSEAGNSAESNGLWYTSSYPESSWISDWQMLANRYLYNSTVIGMDIHNEPHNAYSGGACWDCGGAVDWHLAAERAGNAILAVNPNLLIFVEGTDAYNNDYYWWGGNLEGVAASPVVLNTANQVVYSAHDYGPTEYQQTWFNSSTTYASLSQVWNAHWAYISQNNIAPVWVGEFGTTNNAGDQQSSTPGSEGQWFQSLVNFMTNDASINWTYWALNGEDNYGLLDSNYDSTPANATKQQMLQTIQFQLRSGISNSNPPSAPSGMTATATSTSQVNLSWTATTSSGASYIVYYGTTSSPNTVLVSGLNGTSYSATGLSASTTYYFDVKAVNSSGTSSASNVASATTQTAATAPAAPTGLSATAMSSTEIDLAWTASAGSGVTYNVSQNGSVIVSGLSGTSYKATGLTASTSYSYTVTATNSVGTSAASNSASATTQATPAPNAPSNLAANAVSSSEIDLSWTASATSGVTYTLSQNGSVIASGVSATSYKATGLTANTSYSFSVVAMLNGVSSTASNTASATTQAAPAPAAPSNLTATATSSSQINLSWTASATSGVTYTVYSGATVLASGINGIGYSATNLTASTSYTFTVTASNANGTSAASNTASATTQAAQVGVPNAPSGLNASTTSASQINLSWQASTTSGVTYNVYYGTASGATTNLAASGITSTTYAVTGLSDGTMYYFVVRAANSAGVSAASNQASSTTQTAPPSTPTGLTATAVSATQINLSWSAVANTGATYSVYYGTQSGAENSTLVSGISGTGYAATGLTAGTTYYFVVRSVSPGGTSAPSTQASATTSSANTTVPNAPTNLTATAVSSSQIDLRWTASTTSGVTYTLMQGSTVIASGLSSTGYSVVNLAASTNYTFTVTAVLNGTSSVASNSASATTQAPPAPNAPSNLSATAVSSAEIDLAWTASTTSGVTYTVSSGSTVLASGVSATSYKATGLAASTTYSFTVVAVANGVSSTASNTATATTSGVSTPTAPAAPSNLAATTTNSTQINLSWTASPTSGVTYNVSQGGSVIASSISGTSYSVTGLTPSTAYSFTVTASNANGTSAASNTASATTQAPAAPNAPSNLAATVVSSSEIDLTWTASTTSGVTYTVYSGSTALATSVSGTSYKATGLTPSTAYTFTVTAVANNVASQASNAATATTQAASSGCHVVWLDQNDWGAGFTGNITVTNTGSTAWNNWTLTWTFPGNQQVTSVWNGSFTQTGATVSFTNASWDASVAAGGSTPVLGFNANYSGTNTAPATFYVNGVQCN